MNARNTAYTIQRQLDSRRTTQRWQEKEPMTPKEIESMEAGREMDMLVANTVIEPLSKYPTPYHANQACGFAGCWRCQASCPNYSTRIEDAWTVIEKMRQMQRTVTLGSLGVLPDPLRWGCNVLRGVRRLETITQAEADTAPLAICRAALLAVNQEAK